MKETNNPVFTFPIMQILGNYEFIVLAIYIQMRADIRKSNANASISNKALF